MSLESPGYQTHGGSAGTYAVTEDMHHVADVLARARALVEEADASVRRQLSVAERAAELARYEVSGANFAADDSLRHVLAGSGGTVDVADQIARQSAQVERAADIYVEAESQVGRQVSSLDRLGRGMSDVWGTGLWTARWAGALGWGLLSAPLFTVPGMEKWGVADAVFDTIAPEGSPPTSAYLNRDSADLWLGVMDAVGLGSASPSLYDSTVMQLALATAVLGALMGERGAGATVVPRVDPRCMAAPRGLEDLLNGNAATHSAHDGAVGIQTLTQPNGSQAFIVNVPGTQDWAPWAANPFNVDGNLWAMAAQTAPDEVTQSTAAVEHTIAAMRAADIPSDAPVMLTGYSQGGMVATAIASSAAVRQEFSITHVATANSPVGSYPRPERVNFFHAEDRSDVVAGVDGSRNPDLPNVTSVTGDARSSLDAGVAASARTLVGAHGSSAFTDTVALADAHPSRSVQDYLDSAEAFLGESTSTSYVEYVPASAATAAR